VACRKFAAVGPLNEIVPDCHEDQVFQAELRHHILVKSGDNNFKKLLKQFFKLFFYNKFAL